MNDIFQRRRTSGCDDTPRNAGAADGDALGGAPRGLGRSSEPSRWRVAVSSRDAVRQRRPASVPPPVKGDRDGLTRHPLVVLAVPSHLRLFRVLRGLALGGLAPTRRPAADRAAGYDAHAVLCRLRSKHDGGRAGHRFRDALANVASSESRGGVPRQALRRRDRAQLADADDQRVRRGFGVRVRGRARVGRSRAGFRRARARHARRRRGGDGGDRGEAFSAVRSDGRRRDARSPSRDATKTGRGRGRRSARLLVAGSSATCSQKVTACSRARSPPTPPTSSCCS